MFTELLTFLTFTFSPVEAPALKDCTVTPYVSDRFCAIYGDSTFELDHLITFSDINFYKPHLDKTNAGIMISNVTEEDVFCDETYVVISNGYEDKKLHLPLRIPSGHTVKTTIQFVNKNKQ